MTIDPYTTKPTKARIFAEPLGLGPSDHQWCVDGIDREGNYTESCWSFDTYDQAVAALPEFWANVRGEGR